MHGGGEVDGVAILPLWSPRTYIAERAATLSGVSKSTAHY